ncbi:hypothetical protein DYB32_003134 [Aphanomyces invadans]|uniref:Dynein assembly factor 3, axonemal n=1 Tax=Aphanomyces invadans TaxID=157072 RepID=A0A3R7ABM3_9STRA|nr:hypothetical protein DYB32_003134 [Aphanomyces invadans]
MWGFSPSFDLQEGVSELRGDSNQLEADASSTDPLCVLVVSPGDIRHVLTTIARSRRWKKRPLHIYLYEKSPECLARALLLLQVANDWEIPLRQRCNTFLEVFGNALVQERTAEYIEEKAKQLVHLVCNESGHLADIVDLSHLKMKTRDALVEAFQSWHTSVPFNGTSEHPCCRTSHERAVERLRDQRLRHYYENRYDYRNNLIDWDYTMSLKKIQDASVIHVRQFKEWRNTGVAFEFGDQKYTVPNRTMATYTDAHDVYSGIGEIEDGKVRDGPVQEGDATSENNDHDDVLPRFEVLEDADTNAYPVDHVLPPQRDAQVILLSGPAADLAKKPRYQRKFNHVHVSVHATNLISSPDKDFPITNMCADRAKVSIEASVYVDAVFATTAEVEVVRRRYLLPFKEDQRVAYMQKLVEFAGALDLQTSKQVFGASDAYKRENAVLKFEYARHPSKQATG